MNCTDQIFLPLFILTFIIYAQCEIITLGLVGSALGGLGYYGYEYMKCKYQECCTNEYIHLDFDSKLIIVIIENCYFVKIMLLFIALSYMKFFNLFLIY